MKSSYFSKTTTNFISCIITFYTICNNIYNLLKFWIQQIILFLAVLYRQIYNIYNCNDWKMMSYRCWISKCLTLKCQMWLFYGIPCLYLLKCSYEHFSFSALFGVFFVHYLWSCSWLKAVYILHMPVCTARVDCPEL